jgi:hypothetical protein
LEPRFPFSGVVDEIFPFSEEIGLVEFRLIEIVFPFSVEFGLVEFGLIEVVFPFSVEVRFELMISVLPNS